MPRYPTPLCLFCNRKVEITYPACEECRDEEYEMRLLRQELARQVPETRDLSDVELIKSLWNKWLELTRKLEATGVKTGQRT